MIRNHAFKGTVESEEIEKAVKELGESLSPMFEMKNFKEIVLVVNGGKDSSKPEKKVYECLKQDKFHFGSKLVAGYCNSHGIECEVIKGLCVEQHYSHFIVTAYVGAA